MKASLLLTAITLLASSTDVVSAGPLSRRATSARSGWKTTFWDDFTNYCSTCLPSSSNWIIDTGTSYPGGPSGWGNNELETYTKSTNNLKISSASTLQIIPRKDKSVPGGWTSGRIETQRTDFAAGAGKKLMIESRIKLGTAAASQEQGIWPAFWALGSSFRGNYNNWPVPTEWDFMENLNGQSTVFSTLHCGPNAPGGPCNEYSGLGNGGAPLSNSRGVFHTYTFQVDRTPSRWQDESLTWFVDGKQVLQVKGSRVNDQATWDKVAHQGHFVLLNVAVGGNWPGYPNSATVDGTPVMMEVDYVGVWNT
jgi:beta-glucanase (GH16 family)